VHRLLHPGLRPVGCDSSSAEHPWTTSARN